MVCAIVGDSIANIIHKEMPECASYAQGGISSPQYAASARYIYPILADLTVISLGANDHSGGTLDALRVIRSRISGKVVWLIPNIHRQSVLDAIHAVAAAHGDRLVDTGPYCGPRLHPTDQEARQIVSAIHHSV